MVLCLQNTNPSFQGLPPPHAKWTCALCEVQVGNSNLICPGCGLDPQDAFDVVAAVIQDEQKKLLDRDWDDLMNAGHLGG